jgi:hypothetical protein
MKKSKTKILCIRVDEATEAELMNTTEADETTISDLTRSLYKQYFQYKKIKSNGAPLVAI